MPPKSRKQQVAAIMAEKSKTGKVPAKTGMPSMKMGKMPMPSLNDFAQANVVPKKKKIKGTI